jgi:hypothetical protein
MRHSSRHADLRLVIRVSELLRDYPSFNFRLEIKGQRLHDEVDEILAGVLQKAAAKHAAPHR